MCDLIGLVVLVLVKEGENKSVAKNPGFSDGIEVLVIVIVTLSAIIARILNSVRLFWYQLFRICV